MGSEARASPSTSTATTREPAARLRAAARGARGRRPRRAHRAVERQLADDGVSFGDQPVRRRPVPRLIAADEWDALAAGLAQRTRALTLPDRRLRRAADRRRRASSRREAARRRRGLRARPRRRLPPARRRRAIIGFDLVRDPDGRSWCSRTTCGHRRASPICPGRRDALSAVPARRCCPRRARSTPYLRAAGRGAASGRPGGAAPTRRSCCSPTARPTSPTTSTAAGRGEARRPARHARPARADGDERRDARRPAQWRRQSTSSTAAPTRTASATSTARSPRWRGRARAAWLAGNLGLVNAFGNGVADDKLVHAHVEDFVRFYLGEEPLVRSVPTTPLDSAERGAEAIERLHELVVKPRHGHGGTGVTIGSHADEARARARPRRARAPSASATSASRSSPSRHPTVIEGRLDPRHVDLRPFAFFADEVALCPEGSAASPRRGRDDRQLLAEWRRQGHLGPVTYSIVARDPATGELGVAVQSHWFSVGSIVTWARPGVGAVATQANVETAYGPLALDLLAAGRRRRRRLSRVWWPRIRVAHSRQVAVVDAAGRVAAHTGSGLHPSRRPRHRRRRLLPGQHHGVGARVAGDARGFPRRHRLARPTGCSPRWKPPSGEGGDLRGPPVGGDPGRPVRRRAVARRWSRCESRTTPTRCPSCVGSSRCATRTRSPARPTSCSTRACDDDAAAPVRTGERSSSRATTSCRSGPDWERPQAGDLDAGVAAGAGRDRVQPTWRELLAPAAARSRVRRRRRVLGACA